jgi:hypothetical protein
VSAVAAATLGCTAAELDDLPLEGVVEAYLTGIEHIRHSAYWNAMAGFVGTMASLSAAFGGSFEIADVLEAWLGGLPYRPRERKDGAD